MVVYVENQNEEAVYTLSPEEEQKLVALAETMIQHWDIQATTIELIQGGQLALVWKIHTADGPFCLKRIHRPEKRLYFLFTLKIILPKRHACSEHNSKQSESVIYKTRTIFICCL